MTDTVDRASDANELRLELLRRRLAERGLAATSPDADQVSASATMSDGQRRMWFVQAMDPEGTVANISVSYRLTGPLDAARLEAALAAVAARHPMLRTVYAVDDAGEPHPQLGDVTPAFAWHDLTDLPEQARELRLEVLAQREFATPFRLDADAPLRLTLVRVGADEHVLLLVAHHIAWDDDSWAVFFADLTAAYQDVASFAERPTVTATIATTDADHSADLTYWRTLLAEPPDPLELPGARGSAVPRTLRSGLCTRALSIEMMDGIAELARSNGATPYMVIAAALSALIHRYTATDDFLIASPVLNRTPGSEGAIGYFGNTVVLRARVDAAEKFTDLLARTRDTALGAFEHQGINLDRVVRELNPDRRHGGVERLTRLSFGLRGANWDAFRPDGITCARADYRGKIAQLPLGIMVEAGTDGALIEAEYLHDVLDETLVDQLLRHLVQLLTAAVAQPESAVGELDMLGEDDRAWLDTVSRGPLFTPPAEAPATLGALVADRAAVTPDAIAVVDDDGRYSYAEVNARANRIAHHLIAAGIGTEDKVAVLFGRSLDLVVTALGIAKAGAAYVPIDPEYPPDRIEFILGDARPSLVLHEPLTADDVAGRPDTDPTDADRIRPLRPENLAYLIYTSGSTGLPKGVEVSHAPITEYLLWFGGEYGIDDTDVLLQVASPSFDVSIGELFGTLGNGARLVIPRPDGLRDIGYLTDLLQREGVTAMHFVPSLLGLFLSLPGVNQWRTLRRIPIGGEPLPGELADKFHATFDALLHNFYGPTETVVNSSRYKVEGPQGNRIVPIGSPNINTTIWLLDDALQPVPVGVIGEIYIGGTHVARGYFDRPGLTAERFVADPWTPGQRLYRTGDLARRNAAGDLEFIGRADDQVKVRGFRIELGEVASAISVDPSVGQCVVVVSDLPGLGRSLVAYLTPAGPGAAEDTVEVPRIRARVAAALPEYMAPAAYVVVDDIPITAHGKIDRAALPEPQPIEATPYREPQTETEHLVAELFAQLLSRDQVGADDSFFELGGHSLLATKLVAAIRARCEVEIGIREIFEASTVARLAAAIDRAPAARDGVAAAGRPPLVAVSRSGQQRVSASQLRTWFAYRLDPDATGDNIPLSARLTGPCDTAALIAALGDVVARHDVLRTTFGEIDGVPHQVINAPAAIPVTELHCPETDPVKVAEWTKARLDEQRAIAFDLEHDWPIRPALLHLPGDERVLSLVVHHIAADHWSVEVIFTDLLIAYRSRTAGSAPAWEPPALQYADFAHWQGELLRDESGLIEAQRRYWIEQLAGLADDTGPRPDFPRPATANGSGDSVAFTVPPQVRAGLAALARDTGATEFMVVQSAVAVLLHLAGSGDDIPLGVPIAGRTDNALDNLVGFFVNIVVLRNRLAGNPTLRDVVTRARETALGAYAHADLPFDRLVEALNPVRTLSRNPLFQVVVHVREAADVTHVIETGPGGDLVFRTVMPTFDIAHADLSVNLFTTAGDGEDAGYDGHLIYRTDLYERATVARLADWLGRVLAAMAADPGRTLREISLVDDDQRALILDRWSRGVDIPADDPRTIADVLAPSRTYDGVAVRCAGAELSYPQLHRRSDRLAELLIAAGVQPGTLVGLSVRRDLDLPVALVGIMKAGAGYFPLDPSYPRQRLEFMIDDVAPKVILVSTGTREAIPAPDGVTHVCLDDPAVQAELAKEPTGVDLPVPHPEDPMYLVFTSGSTGVPKGVLGTHRSMSARLNWQIAHYPVDGADIRLAQSSMTFLEGGMEMLAGLAAGATLILADDDEFRDPEALARLIVDERVAQVTAVASLISVLAESDDTLRGLRRLVCSGEPVSADLLARLGEALDPSAQLLNNFGATETSGAAVRGELSPPTPKLGRPTPGSQAYLLDDALQPVPPGVVGEVYYAGPQIVRGYWKRPELTATRFVANPFAEPGCTGSRLYRSGDRARWTADGVLEFVGRTDHQVKVRGFRVELAEVEAALRGAPGVAAAAARTWEQRGVTTLAGYLVPAGPVADAAEFIASVRAAVAATLPGYMVPSSLTVLETMPLTDSGKLNRPALPAPAVATRGQSDPPVTATERALAGIVADLLGVEAVGRSDGFFELGGDSILSVQLAARARAAGLDVDPRMIFEHPTLAELAAAVDRRAAAGDTTEPADTAYAPMSVSGLSSDALADLTASWGDSP
ncbi:amino acid adenylation domain-containing protein [[Mycobacterium] kokjensenii]|uniref:Amino acid adenylation domain-containing protein n=1 Tax=[Mycobacterium] kokjensenii TaxID=3064287 RepID=A0ABM9LBL3_9MYCO|nr:non-ribosomal peptide synthetase [Mycolicibacter sp. MU0083]CAJ1496248.1 amino acid adenylation domain-containing protein [Mycolicibacter sp. MU0083]